MRWTLIAAAEVEAEVEADVEAEVESEIEAEVATVLPQYLIAFLSHCACCIYSLSAGNVVLSLSLSIPSSLSFRLSPIAFSSGLGFGLDGSSMQSLLAVHLSCISSFMHII